MSIERFYRPFTLIRPSSGAGSVAEPGETTVGVYRGHIQPTNGSETLSDVALRERYANTLYTYVATPAEYGDFVEQDGVRHRVVFSKQAAGIAGQSHHKEIGLEYV